MFGLSAVGLGGSSAYSSAYLERAAGARSMEPVNGITPAQTTAVPPCRQWRRYDRRRHRLPRNRKDLSSRSSGRALTRSSGLSADASSTPMRTDRTHPRMRQRRRDRPRPKLSLRRRSWRKASARPVRSANIRMDRMIPAFRSKRPPILPLRQRHPLCAVMSRSM